MFIKLLTVHLVEGLGLQTQDQFNQWAFAFNSSIQILVNFEIFKLS